LGGSYDTVHTRVDSPQSMDSELGTRAWDIVFSDFTMPQFNAFDALAGRVRRITVRQEAGLNRVDSAGAHGRAGAQDSAQGRVARARACCRGVLD